MKDEIIAEVWRNRDSLAAKYGHNLSAIVAALRREGRRTSRSGGRKPPSKRATARRSR